MPVTVKSHSLMCIFSGDFNPAGFHPLLLQNNNLIDDATKADVQVVSPQISSFAFDDIVLQVMPDKLTVECNASNKFMRARDIVCGILKIVEQSPIKQYSLSTMKHFKIGDSDAVSSFFSKFVNVDSFGTVVSKPIVRSLILHESTEGKFPVQMIRVEPSVLFPPGLFFEISCHYQDQSATDSLKALKTVSNDLQKLIDDAEGMMEKILKKGEIQ